MRQTWLADVLRAGGLGVVEHPGWKTRGNTGFAPKGLVCHHTGPWSTVEGMVKLCINGRSDLPGPLCQIVLAPDGVCHVIAAGRANHAGTGGWRGLTGNSSVFGIEAIHTGSSLTPWPEAQLVAFRAAAAALVYKMQADPSMICGHKEWTSRKIDPVSINMDAFRADVVKRLAPQEKVAAMYSPPLTIVAALDAPERGVWMLALDGAIYAYAGAMYKGGANGKDYWGARRAARLEPFGQGYTIVAEDGGRYDYP